MKRQLSYLVPVMLVAACTLPELEETEPTKTEKPATVSTVIVTTTTSKPVVTHITTTRQQPVSIVIEPEHEGGYERKLFKHWSDFDNDGCDTRREVLIEESLIEVVVAGKCSLQGGRWYSAFDGIETTDPSTFDVDHMVPLKEAWDSGAWAWDPTRREAFANDMSIPESLIAVSASSNRSKGAKDPAEWMPPSEDFHCAYLAAWIAVKQHWGLSMDQAEHDVVSALRIDC